MSVLDPSYKNQKVNIPSLLLLFSTVTTTAQLFTATLHNSSETAQQQQQLFFSSATSRSNSSLDAKNPPSAHRLYRTYFVPRDNKCHVATTGGIPPIPPFVTSLKKNHVGVYSGDIKPDAVGVDIVRCFDGLVVKTSRCGREDPGSNPGRGIFFHLIW